MGNFVEYHKIQSLQNVEGGGFWVRLASHPVSPFPVKSRLAAPPNQTTLPTLPTATQLLQGVSHSGPSRSNCCAALLSVQIKPSHDSPDHLCLHPKQKHCKPSPTVIFLLLENIHSRVSFFRQFNRSVIFICISKYVQTTTHINVSK